MKFHVPRMVLFGLFAFAAMGSASATQMKTSTPAFAAEVATVQASKRVAVNPWPTVASIADKQTGPLLAHDDRYWHDGRWHDRRDDWRRDTGAATIGVESRPAAKRSVVVIGSAVTIGPCSTATRTITATIAASAALGLKRRL